MAEEACGKRLFLVEYLRITHLPSVRSLPSLNALRAFEAAARHGSFKAAAEELHVTATAISHQVRHLETGLGVELFRRRPRPLRLTACGRRLFDGLRDGFDRIGTAVASVAKDSGPLVVTTTPAFASRWLIPRLSALRRACGGLDLAIEASERVFDLHAGAVDFAIRYARAPDPALTCRALFVDRYVPVCHPDLLAPEGGIVRLSDLDRHPVIRFRWKRNDASAPTWERWLAAAADRFPKQALPRLGHGLHFSEEIHAIEAAVDGQGIALVSDLLVARELESGLLRVPVDLAIDGLTFFAMYRPDAARLEAIEQVVEQLLRNAGT